MMAGMSSRSLVNTAFGLVVMVSLDLVLVPSHQAVGAAIGWGVAVAAKNVLGLAQAWHSLRLHPFGRATLTALTLNAGFLGLAEGLRDTLPFDELTVLILSVVGAGSAYLAAAWALRGPLELRQFRALRRGSRPVTPPSN
jgi:O-antigen/teichoic acid export membrane protein